MRRKQTNPKLKQSAINQHVNKTDAYDGNGMYLDPANIRFQHSRIRPFFSGCGQSVHETLESIRNGKTSVLDIPPIQVLMGSRQPNTRRSVIHDRDNHDDDDDNTKNNRDDADGVNQWYVSLNNRRLWVLKRLREEGLLEEYGNKVYVRVRAPKNQQEQRRYALENCALDAKIMHEKGSTKIIQREDVKEKKEHTKRQTKKSGSCLDDNGEWKVCTIQGVERSTDDHVVLIDQGVPCEDDECDADDLDLGEARLPASNRFGALML